MKNRILLTGCAGFIGSHISDRLVAEGYSVTGVDNLCEGEMSNVNSDLTNFILNEFDCEEVLASVRAQKFSHVIHCAALPRVGFSVDEPAHTNYVNVQQTLNLMNACRGVIKRFIFSSSSSVYGEAVKLPTPNFYPKEGKSPYALQKGIIEDYLKMFAKLYDMDSISLRYFNVFGARAKAIGSYPTAIAAWIHAIKNDQKLICYGDGEQTRDLVHVDNVVSANMLAMTSKTSFKGDCFNVGCGERISNNDILKYLKDKVPNTNVVYEAPRAGDIRHTLADISITERVLSYKIIVPFWEGLDRAIGEIFVKSSSL